MNNKGGLTDLFVAIIYIVILGVFCVIFYFAANTTHDALIENSDVIQTTIGDSGNATAIIEGTYGAVPNTYENLKWITFAIMIFLFLSMVISSYLITVGHPVYFIAYFFIIILAIIFSVPISNTYETLRFTPELASSFSGFYGQNFIFANLPIWITVFGFISGILMYIGYSKSKEFYT